MSDNPYQSPQVMGVPSGGGADPSLDRAVSMLRQTKPWVRFISVMMFIGSAFMVLGGLFMMAIGAGGGAGGAGWPGAAFGVGLGVAYIVFALLYIVPAVFLWKYADRIAVFMRERSTGALASALESQKSFWKFVGILMLIMLVIYAGIFVLGIFGAIVGAMAR